MYEAHADDFDRRIVAEEAVEIFTNHPVLTEYANHYTSMRSAVALLSEAIAKSKKEKGGSGEEKQENAFKKNSVLIQSFCRELMRELEKHFVDDSFSWLIDILSHDPTSETDADKKNAYKAIERACRDVLSVMHEVGFSLESLYSLYRDIGPTQKTASAATNTYDFMARLSQVQAILVAAPTEYRVIFSIGGLSSQAHQVGGNYGALTLSDQPPQIGFSVPPKIEKRLVANEQRLFADVEVKSKDGRSAGMQAYRAIGKILDLIRFEYESRNLEISNEFIIVSSNKATLLPLPQLIPNPKPELSTPTLSDFVSQLDSVAERDGRKAETRDRIFSAFRLYRVGTQITVFENKLVNWWTALEYLVKGSKSGGAIGAGVENSLTPTLGLIYLPKHLSAFRSALHTFGISYQESGNEIDFSSISNLALYQILRDPSKSASLISACVDRPYLWHHISAFAENLSSLANIALAIKAHEKRLRWQIQRIYRARCDIVHSGSQVGVPSLLCANLEFYLRITLSSMLSAFKEVPTLLDPGEFFERKKHQYNQVLINLSPVDKGLVASDQSLINSL